MYGTFKRLDMNTISNMKKAYDLGELSKSNKLNLPLSNSQNIEFCWGAMYEWGLPFGHLGRHIILAMIAELSHKHWILWTHANEESQLNYDSWTAHNINEKTFRVAHTKEPLKDLRAAIISPSFKVIVIDGAKDLNDISLAFLHHKAKELKKLIFVIRPFYLSPKKGCIWSKKRINIDYKVSQNKLLLKSIKGYRDYEIDLIKELA